MPTCCVHETTVEAVQKQLPDEAQQEELAEFFRVMGSSTRIGILCCLMTQEEMCVGDIAAAYYVLDAIDVQTTGFDEDSEKPVWGNASHNPDNVILNQKEINDKKVPNVVGMGAKDAVYLLESMGLRVQITGIGKVKSQSIPAGNTLHKGRTIQLRLH